MNRDEFANIVRELLRVTAHFDQAHLNFEDPRRPDTTFAQLSLLELDELLSAVDEIERGDEYPLAVYSANSAYIAIDYLDPRHARIPNTDLVVEDDARGLRYEVGRAQGAHLLMLAAETVELPAPERPRLNTASLAWRYEYRDGRPIDILDALSGALRIDTLRISSTNAQRVSNWRYLSEAFFFHVGYNLDYPMIARTELSPIGRASRIQRMRRSRAAELDPPRSHYSTDLVRSYQLALSSESPMLSYLSFYHVAEHWFEEIFLDSIATTLRSRIASPGFSTRRNNDLRELISIVSKAIKSRDDELVQINEEIALRLTLEKFVDITSLRNSLQEYDSEVLQYFKETILTFSSGDKVDFSQDPSSVFKQLSRRIYKTRNALVHRKSGARGRFTPFSDDKLLSRELPLMRFVAEQIIIASGNPQ